MARRSAEPVGQRRIAVVGAASPAGTRLKTALADRGVDGARVVLYGAASKVAVLSEYDGEARLVQPVGDLDPKACAAVFVCEPGHDGGPFTRAAAGGTLVVDLSGSIEGAKPVAHPISVALAAILMPLHAAAVIRRASAVVLRPAADFGEQGLEELREQTVHLLRFEKTPTEVFGRQLAFNVVPDHLLPEEEAGAADRIVAECREALGDQRLPLDVTTALVPIFLGHAVSLSVELERGGLDEARASLEGAAGLTLAEGGEAGCTMDALEDDGISIAALSATGPRSIRIWAVVADAGRAAASRAVEVADAAGVL
jgi:aspartate-semialdehyde dehydrogenase